jgi:hypothetical protein
MASRSRYLEAFKEGHNLVGLSGLAAVSLATLNVVPLLVGLVAEAAYLIFVPDSKWYERRLAKKYDAEVEQRRAQLKESLLPTLRPDIQDAYARLEAMRAEIGVQVANDPNTRSGSQWFREVLRKLDYLLEKFLQFASKDAQFRAYLAGVLADLRSLDSAGPQQRGKGRGPLRLVVGGAERDEPARDPSDRWTQRTVAEIQAQYEEEREEVARLMEQEPDESTRAVLQKRLDVMERRKEFVGKMGRILINLNHQLKLLEDTFGLINDELRARSPDQVLSDIEDVVLQTNTMTDLLEEVAPFEQMLQRMSA